jgi:hypothetical protein
MLLLASEPGFRWIFSAKPAPIRQIRWAKIPRREPLRIAGIEPKWSPRLEQDLGGEITAIFHATNAYSTLDVDTMALNR